MPKKTEEKRKHMLFQLHAFFFSVTEEKRKHVFSTAWLFFSFRLDFFDLIAVY